MLCSLSIHLSALHLRLIFFPSISQLERVGNQLITKKLVALTFIVLISKQQQRGGVSERQQVLHSMHNHNVGCNHATQSISQNDIYESVGSNNETSLSFIFLQFLLHHLQTKMNKLHYILFIFSLTKDLKVLL